MISGACHCGAISWVLEERPPHLVTCTCGLCHRYGVIWGHGTQSTVTVTGACAGVIYVHGDRTIDFHRCGACGCVTHYTARPGGGPDDRVSVNMRMADPVVLTQFTLRTFDGADTWAYLD